MHKSVLLKEVIEYLNPQPGQNFIDCTIGDAGHSSVILEKTKPDGKVLGIDIDYESLKRIKAIEGFVLVGGNFKDLKRIAEENNFNKIDGILFDLGLSSWQIEESGKGFTFKKDEPLTMILNGGQVVTAQEIINTWPEESLLEIFKKYGEERFARKIVQKIVRQRGLSPIKTTLQLFEIIKRSIPYSKTRRGNITRVAARIFQALRIVVNDELENLKKGLEQALQILNKEGRIVVVSFHSLEDGVVKRFFKEKEKQGILRILTKKPITAGKAENEVNPRSRSAKLRAAISI
ncbi:MAG TPA: 16S rRNA (cytosine(1402)-N(4))-methyltransferase RsmH [Candidatus Paceibacterota bacterium]|nr:16S rRNA (cytosine(1402)-N(4))-methyltransferase RsmH [Candidatus Paceibacterota bacterium]